MRMAPVSRRDRPAKPPLTREGVVAVALRVLSEEGLERVTMRRLAAELDTGPASLYVYVENAAELHAALLDELLGAAGPVPARAPEQWRGELVEVLTAHALLLAEHPGLARSVLALRPSGPHYLALVERVLALLERGGVPVQRAAWGVDLLLQLATATAAEQGTRRHSAQAEAEHAALTLALMRADPLAHPATARAGGHLVSGSGSQRLQWAFTALVAGIATSPTPEAHPAQTPTHDHQEQP